MTAPRPSQRPYFLRAYHAWVTDSGLTPHLIVNAAAPGVEAPAAQAQDGRLVLNVSLQATDELTLGNEAVEFSARFGTAVHHVRIPIGAVLGLYARETGEGLAFAPDESPGDAPAGPGERPERPRLTIVK
ncbi:MAG TPA: ClpXP protease specificity-enhancing factor SspB [Gammaproteobacteria bacterium]|nr:ClpXP protease specificity-enhancing factor SspB [Gammaproteobacteria bacterium]